MSAPLSFLEARRTVLDKVAARKRPLETEPVELNAAAGRVLAREVRADRDYPPFDRSTRDGFAVRASDAAAGAELRLLGEVRAGEQFAGSVAAGECVSIMTGAPVPAGADAVLMVEYAAAGGNIVRVQRPVAAGENVVPRGSETPAAAVVLAPGKRLGYPEIAMLASVGCAKVEVFRRPRVAILPTGDEIVEAGREPLPFQIRNSNSHSLQVQVAAAGGVPCPLGIGPDEPVQLRLMLERGLDADLLLVSGGVSMGKYDLVERVLRDLGAEFYFDAVAIQPGKPLVFGQARGTFFFGLPGNPLSTMVTFELFGRAALDVLSGCEPAPLLFLRARLEAPVRHKTGLTRFLPAIVRDVDGEPMVRPEGWQGSGDIASLTRSNCYIVVPSDKAEIAAGEYIGVLPRH